MKNMLSKIFKLPFLMYLKFHQKKFCEVKYLSFKRNSKVLAIVFSAFDSDDAKRAYNYVKSFSRIPIDFVFLSDPWGYRGSYYLYDNGKAHPQIAIQKLVNQHINRRERGGYSTIVTLGTSKGGTAALYYGLKCKADEIIIGACQYRIGSYVANYPMIFKGMTGHDINGDDIDSLDKIMPNVIREGNVSKSRISLIHSIKEPTYERDIKYLIHDLTQLNYTWKEYECGFENHNDVGAFFIPIAKKLLNSFSK